jgi:peroxiredoxin
MQSELARLRAQIILEYQASKRVFTDFTPTARHEFLIKRQENIAACFDELKKHVAPEEAMGIMIQADNEAHGASVPSS